MTKTLEAVAKNFNTHEVIKDSEDEYTLVYTMKDGGGGLIDVYFYNGGDRMELQPDSTTESAQQKELFETIYNTDGVGDWLDWLHDEGEINGK